MSCDLQCPDSTPIDKPELRSLPPQPSDYRLNDALTYVAQEVNELLQQSHLAVEGDNNPIGTVAFRAIEPEYKFIITIEPLTDRELEVLQLIVDGHNNIWIAEELYITTGTVKTHVQNILKKLCVEDRTQAVIRALRSGLVHSKKGIN
ncbi:helix-turn-helix domain-containing protein [Chroococcidiopsis thermalis]|uniref:Transcriptional regulator, LuxR family n=1 Tax=Chroococcidiopsis thermalis (strain PCC 7203) TaxID=251229 RepID=K9UA24_CHRTP|nr:response regulator transcription factor [Chroococcidiopsis thermalis]AFY91099.1 transcriptional regulator, LuxR family [Chroococcidiopsis thermalis PCC 7203]